MTAFGLGMNGMEDRLTEITRHIASTFDEVTYIEIGVAEGTTLAAVAALLNASGKKWRAVGIELPNGYSYSEQRTREIALNRSLKLDIVTPNGNIQRPHWGQITVFLKDSQTFLTELWQEPVHFALIDGCHGRPCVILDFLALEAWMVKDGLMMFHDFGEEQVGQAQPHCSGGVDVHGACYELGLLTGKRPGWSYADTITADHAAGGWDMGVFRKEK